MLIRRCNYFSFISEVYPPNLFQVSPVFQAVCQFRNGSFAFSSGNYVNGRVFPENSFRVECCVVVTENRGDIRVFLFHFVTYQCGGLT